MTVELSSTTNRRRLGRLPFALGLGAILVAGMIGLLWLNIHIQTDSFALRASQRSAAALANQVAAMQAEVNRVSAPTNLAQQASALGMCPDPYGVYLSLPGGTVTGTPTPVKGNEVPRSVPTGSGSGTPPIQIKLYPPPLPPAATAATPAESGPVPAQAPGEGH